MTTRRKTLATTASVLALCMGAPALTPAMALAAPDTAQAVQDYQIAAQPLRAALIEFSRQSRSPVVASTALVQGLNAPAVEGRMNQAQALDALLAGTGLTAAFNLDGGWSISRRADQGPQGGSAAGNAVQALIVTAQKREEDIQDVPIAISAFSQEDLTRSQVAGGPDLMTQVPNMTFTKTNFTGYSIQIRGIGTQAISATTDPAVAVAFNNTPFVRNRFFEQEFYDLQRVEVLRGPQGTLYGRNATAGVVNLISRKPTFHHDAKLSADVANYGSTRVEGMVNIPLVDDAVALRAAGAWTRRDGFVTNEITGNPIDGRDLWSTRLSIRIAPPDAPVDINLVWEHFEENDDRLRSGKQLCKKDLKTEVAGVPIPPFAFTTGLIDQPVGVLSQGCAPSSLYSPDSFQTPNGYSLPYYQPLGAIGLPVVPNFDPYLSTTQSRDLRVIESTVDPEYRASSDVFQLQADIDIADGLTLTSETSYSADFVFSLQDFNRFNTAPGAFDQDAYDNKLAGNYRPGVLSDGYFCDPQIGCANRLVGLDLSTAESRQFSQELRLSSDFGGPLNFSLGANYLRYDTEDKYYVFINTLTAVAATGLNAINGGIADQMPPYVGGVSDNHECLPNNNNGYEAGFLPGYGDPYVRQKLTPCIYIDPNPIGSLNDLGHNYFLSRNPYKLISYAVFGEAYYQIAPALKVTAGLRWTVDKKEAPRIPSWLLAANSVGHPVAETIEQEWREPTGRLTVDWKPDLAFTDDTLLYVSYAHGYKAGGANPPPATIVTYSDFADSVDNLINQSLTSPKTFGPEFVDAFEVGAKNTLLDGALTLNLTAFYYDYKGYQISRIVDRSASNLNFDAEVWGAEIEIDWRPLENLKLGFRGGYENTRVADGMKAIDLMDRTAGNPDWIVARPFPTIPSNCILPVWLVTYGGQINLPPQRGIPNDGPCALAYVAGLDPVTERPYEPNPTHYGPDNDLRPLEAKWAGYPGFDPSTAPNNGQGFYTDLSGNELPNAPNFTATLTADYTLPLPNDWLMTLHTDLYYQSEAWTRIFNMEGYDKLKAYTNVNLAAIFTNEDQGWNVMAYVKNVFDRDSITGAFLFSDDVGLTTNVFLTEPRLYGLRVTKEFAGGGLLGNFGGSADGPAPFNLEVAGGPHWLSSESETYEPDWTGLWLPSVPFPLSPQGEDLDTGDDRQVKLTYSPQGPDGWQVAASLRHGRANGFNRAEASEQQPEICVNLTPSFRVCAPGPLNWASTAVRNREEYAIGDVTVGRGVDLGWLTDGGMSVFSAGLQYAELRSESSVDIKSNPDYAWPANDPVFGPRDWHHFDTLTEIERRFSGAGPVASWDASRSLFGDETTGRVMVDWEVTGGVLFGEQETTIREQTSELNLTQPLFLSSGAEEHYDETVHDPVLVRSEIRSVTTPTAGVSLGLSYQLNRFSVGAGYRWQRYYDAIDGGVDEAHDADRTIDGPYFKLSVGFGG